MSKSCIFYFLVIPWYHWKKKQRAIAMLSMKLRKKSNKCLSLYWVSFLFSFQWKQIALVGSNTAQINTECNLDEIDFRNLEISHPLSFVSGRIRVQYTLDLVLREFVIVTLEIDISCFMWKFPMSLSFIGINILWGFGLGKLL